MSGCSGLHCAGCAAGAAVPVVPALEVYGFVWVVEHLIEVIVTSAVCGALAVYAVICLMRWADRRDARRTADRPLLYTRDVPAVAPAGRRRIAPAVVFNFYGPGGEETAARVIRQALPGQAGHAITERPPS